MGKDKKDCGCGCLPPLSQKTAGTKTEQKPRPNKDRSTKKSR
jgi:hypothetical protein